MSGRSTKNCNSFLAGACARAFNNSEAQSLATFADSVLLLAPDHSYAVGNSDPVCKMLDEICLKQKEKDHTYSTSSRSGRTHVVKQNSSVVQDKCQTVSDPLPIHQLRKSSSEENLPRVDYKSAEEKRRVGLAQCHVVNARKSMSFERVCTVMDLSSASASPLKALLHPKQNVPLPDASSHVAVASWSRKEDHTYATFSGDCRKEPGPESVGLNQTQDLGPQAKTNDEFALSLGRNHCDHTYDKAKQHAKQFQPSSTDIGVVSRDSAVLLTKDHTYFSSCVQGTQCHSTEGGSATVSSRKQMDIVSKSCSMGHIGLVGLVHQHHLLVPTDHNYSASA